METLAPVLGGLGVVGMIAAFLLGFAVLLILPLWAILHCLASDRPGGSKLFLCVALIFTWGLGAIFYAMFISGSRPFRVFTVVAVLLPVVILVPSVISLVTGTAIHGRALAEQQRAELQALVDGFQPAILDAGPIDPFVALHFTSTAGRQNAATLARFTASGPSPESARAVDTRVLHVAHDSAHDRYFALTSHKFGALTMPDGSFSEIDAGPVAGEFHWPKGVAFDTTRGRAVVLTSHVTTTLFTFDSGTSEWRQLPARFDDLPLIGLAHSPDHDMLFAVEHRSGKPGIRRIHRFNPEGASLGPIELDPPIPASFEDRDRLQLGYSSGWLTLVLPPDPDTAEEQRLLFIDPSDGRVFLRRDDPYAPSIAVAR